MELRRPAHVGPRAILCMGARARHISLVFPARRNSRSRGGLAHLRVEGSGIGRRQIGAIAPLVGLLGTVLGMFQAFGGIASDVSAGAKPMVLAQGVSQAIVTTIFGLVVAIPSLLAYAFFRRRAQRRIAEVEERVVEHFASLPA